MNFLVEKRVFLTPFDEGVDALVVTFRVGKRRVNRNAAINLPLKCERLTAPFICILLARSQCCTASNLPLKCERLAAQDFILILSAGSLRCAALNSSIRFRSTASYFSAMRRFAASNFGSAGSSFNQIRMISAKCTNTSTTTTTKTKTQSEPFIIQRDLVIPGRSCEAFE